MLDAEKLQKIQEDKEMTETEVVAQKKRLAAKILRKEDRIGAKNGIVYIVLAFFFGTLGLHNFYAGYWGRGLAQLCLTLVAPWFLYIPLLFVAVWVLLELLFIGKSASGKAFSGNRLVITILKIAAVVALAMAFSWTSLVVDEPDFEEIVINA